MADARVKNMLKQFESVDNMSAGRGKKPDLAVKPVLQRFQQNIGNAANSSESSPSPAPKPVFNRPAGQSGVKLAGLTGSNSAARPSLIKSADKNSDDVTEKGRVGVPKVFQNGQTPGNNDDNNNKSNGAASDRSQTVSKFPSNHNNSFISSKPPVSGTKPDNNNIGSNINNKTNKFDNKSLTSARTALLPKNAHSKTDSISSISSSSSTSSSNQTTTVSSPSTTSSSSTSPPSPEETGVVIDFRSQLRKVSNASGPPVKKVLSGVSSDASTTSSTPKSPTSPTPPTSATTSSTTVSPKTETPSRVPPIPTSDIQLRRKQSEDVIERKSDGRKFRKISLPSPSSGSAPSKPTVPSDVDLTSIREQYLKALASADSTDGGTPLDEVDDDDVYCDGESEGPAVTSPPPLPKKPVETNRASERVSLIPDMSPEEEGIDLPVYDDTPIEEEIYDDAVSEKPNMSKQRTSTSSEPQSPTESEPDKRKRLKEEAAAKKKEEKEKRDKEKRERDEEKKRKKKEEDDLKLRNKFNLTGQEKMVGEGVIKQDAKASGLNIKVKKGQIVTIVRLDSNPPNKWLVKVDNQMGYVDSKNIEVDPNIIRQAMTGGVIEEEQPTYDDVPEEMAYREEDGELIYEECS